MFRLAPADCPGAAEWIVRAGTCEAICCESAGRQAAQICAIHIQYKTRISVDLRDYFCNNFNVVHSVFGIIGN